MKNTMKKNKVILIFLILSVLSSTLIVNSHPGRTDANGGHWDRSNGTYHFHTGEYSGKRSSSSSSTKSKYDSFTPPYDPPEKNPYKTNSTKNNSSEAEIPMYMIVIFSICITIFLLGIVVGIYENYIKIFLPGYNIKLFNEKLSALKDCYDDILKTEDDLLKCKTKFCIPENYEIGDDGLPKEKLSKKWGKTFTLYKTPSGSKLHIKKGCCSADIPKHIFPYYTYSDFDCYLCSKCSKNYKFPDLSWFENYLLKDKLLIKLKNLEVQKNDIRNEVFLLNKKCNSKVYKLLLFCRKKQIIKLSEANQKYQTYILEK